MTHQFQRDVRVAIDTRRLALLRQERKDLVDVRHVEITTETEVLGPPVVTAQEGVYERQAALACGRVAQVTHQQLALHLLGHTTEYLGDGILSLGLLTEHILRARLVLQTNRGDTGTLLSAVVLLLHHQIQLVETIGPRTILFLVVVQRLQQANHRHATLMLQLLHILFLLQNILVLVILQ